MTKKYLSFILPAFMLFIFVSSNAQFSIDRIDPPHWWTEMKNDTLYLLIYGKNLSGTELIIRDKHVKVLRAESNQSGNYFFADLLISPHKKAGDLLLEFRKGNEKAEITYPLKKRDPSGHQMAGLDGSDLIYLIMPDRFANGDTSNDVFDSMVQNTMNRDSAFYRHGGDLQGIRDHVNYFTDLGVTALWLNPVEENNQPLESYHGYAITDHYRVDPRLGDNQTYKKMVNELHANGIKIIRDVVFNHFGSENPLIKELPDSTWIHHFDKFTKTTYRATTLLDPHGAKADRKLFLEGWFDRYMPDMNFDNTDLRHYMIQNSIWWIEEMDIDAYRIDTYAYPEQDFMREWAKAVKAEYPGFFLFAETWVQGPVIQAWFAGGNKMNQGETHLDGLTDFHLHFAINRALNSSFGWTSGVSEIYYALVNDLLYAHPENNVIFLDNHDMNRIYGTLGRNPEKLKMGIALLMTLRGIPSIFYGTEIAMPYTGNHGIIRTDFPGGWPGDTLNKFSAEGRTDFENEIFDYTRTLAKWRRGSLAVSKGKLKQFVPENGVYVFFRYAGEDIVMVAVNQNDKAMEIDLERLDEVLKGRREFKDITDKYSFTADGPLVLKPMHVHVFEVR